MKKVLIPWSGGLDSTYLVYENLEAGNQVRTFSVKLGNNPNQSEREAASRKVMTKWFKENYSELFIESFHDNEFACKIGNNISIAQAPIWVIMSFYSENFCDVDEIQMGYVMNDDAVSYLDDIKKLYNSYKSLTKCVQPKLKFPIIKMKKYEIINKLPEFLFKNISVCEYYGEENCNCQSCQRHNLEMKLSKRYVINEENIDKKTLINQLEIQFN